MITYFRMKLNKWRLKNKIYTEILDLMDSKGNIKEMVQKVYDTVKDTDIDELKELIVSKVVDFVTENENK